MMALANDNSAKAEYISCPETAKLIRALLKKSFPGVKFSVRSSSYARGASIDVRWKDGPLTAQVDALVAPFAGRGFDGMIDLAYSKEAWLLPDGSATWARIEGTSGSKGMVEGASYLQPSAKAKRVHFGANYVHTTREYSLGMYERARDKVCRTYGVDPAAYPCKDGYYPGLVDPNAQLADKDSRWGWVYLSELIQKELSRRTNFIPAAAKAA